MLQQHCADFVPQFLHQSYWMQTRPRTFGPQKFGGKSSTNAVRICFLELGGTKTPGHAPSGICRRRMANCFAFMKAREPGKWMESMTEGNRNLRFVNRESRLPERCTM